MSRDERLLVLKNAHQKYVDWWHPMDVAAGSIMGAMSCHRFCETLLTYNDEWYDRWIEDSIPKDKKQPFKVDILRFIIGHYGNIIDLNKNE
jgi:hypothetical protein